MHTLNRITELRKIALIGKRKIGIFIVRIFAVRSKLCIILLRFYIAKKRKISKLNILTYILKMTEL